MIWDVLSDEDEQMFITGVTLVMDFTNFGMNHLTAIPVATVKKLMSCWEVYYNQWHQNNEINTFAFDLGC
jgi:hypothetical protein